MVSGSFIGGARRDRTPRTGEWCSGWRGYKDTCGYTTVPNFFFQGLPGPTGAVGLPGPPGPSGLVVSELW